MDKKVAIVTGGSSGIGKEIAKHLYRNGMEVYALSRRVDEMNDLDDLGIKTKFIDVADYDSVESTISDIVDEAGRIDVLVNNAGFGAFGSVEQVDIREGEYQFKVNVFGVMKLIQTVLPTMRAQKSGRIINISSIDGKVASLMGSWYVGSKFAIEGISDALRLELKQFGIDVVVVEPGAIKSNWRSIAMSKLKQSSGDGPYAKSARKISDFFEVAYKYSSKPMVVARAVDQAALSKRPKTRYAVGSGAHTLLCLRRILPDKAFDAFMDGLMDCAQKILNKEKAQRNQIDPEPEVK
ncbi:oxidoreductase [Lentilactobacillus sp. Marseille-Q4993]|uniref:oxidoreductase n=1 Tax=Lentilactobacillus sp. Marseille-Q4993 TaxID=3039492 RepID=UPI0024BC3844|nr:oxidoreductase [Lentilactobacillus sp. Marseille-Q4993]